MENKTRFQQSFIRMIEKHIQPQTCTICSTIYSSNSARSAHYKEYHLSGKYDCQLCPGNFTTKEYLVNHLKSEHNESKLMHLAMKDTSERLKEMIKKNEHLVQKKNCSLVPNKTENLDLTGDRNTALKEVSLNY